MRVWCIVSFPSRGEEIKNNKGGNENRGEGGGGFKEGVLEKRTLRISSEVFQIFLFFLSGDIVTNEEAHRVRVRVFFFIFLLLLLFLHILLFLSLFLSFFLCFFVALVSYVCVRTYIHICISLYIDI